VSNAVRHIGRQVLVRIDNVSRTSASAQIVRQNGAAPDAEGDEEPVADSQDESAETGSSGRRRGRRGGRRRRGSRAGAPPEEAAAAESSD
jgi:hypothetical protein